MIQAHHINPETIQTVNRNIGSFELNKYLICYMSNYFFTGIVIFWETNNCMTIVFEAE